MLSEQLKNYSPQQIEDIKKKIVLKPLSSVEELRAWMFLFFDIDFPSGVVYPTSTHGPADAMWRIYELMKTGKSQDIPQITMLSSRDSFKCSAKGTKILYKDKIKNIEDVRVDDVIWSGKNWQKVTDWIDDGFKSGIKISTISGHSSIHSPIHRVWTLRDGIEQWVKMKELNPKTDLVCINLPKNQFQIDNKTTDYEIGYFLGLLSGDGTTTQIDNSGQFGISTVDNQIKEFLYNFNKKYFKGEVREANNHGKRTPTYYFRAGDNVKLIKNWGVKSHRANDKEIPSRVWDNKNSMIGFFNGLFDTDGTFNSKNQIEIPITAHKLLKDLQILLNAMGIHCHFKSNKKKYGIQNHIIHRLYINGNDIANLVKLGFQNKSFKKNSLTKPKIPNAHDTIPVHHLEFIKQFIITNKHIAYNCRGRKILNHKMNPHRFGLYDGLTYSNIEKYCDWLEETINMNGFKDPTEARKTLNRIKNLISNKWLSFTIESIEKVHFFDLTVENDHCYWSNGLISHNTLSAAALEVLCFTHFRISIAHAAAIVDQSDKAVQYANGFFRDLRPYLEYHGWKRATDNKKKIEWITDTGESIYLRILVMSIRGMNCIVGRSKIKTDQGNLKASEIYKKLENGESISFLSYNHDSDEPEYKPVVNRWKNKKNKLYRIKTKKSTLLVSAEHQIFVKDRGYVLAKDLRKGDIVLRSPYTITKKERKQKPFLWTEERLLEEANKFSTHIEFQKNNPNAYKSAQSRKLLDDICKHMNFKYETWDFDKIQKESLKYKSREDFKNGNRKAYGAARTRDILDDVCAHMDYKNTKWSKEDIVKEALKYTGSFSFQKNNPKAYSAGKRNNILNEICSHMIKPIPKKKYSLEVLRETALKYQTRNAFAKNDHNMYMIALRRGLLNEICPHMPIVSNNSLSEKNLTDIIREKYPKAQKLIDRKVKIMNKPYIQGFEIDIYIPELRKGIEFDGTYWHSPNVMKTRRPNWPINDVENYHEIKDDYFKSKGIELLHIKEEDWISSKDECVDRCFIFLNMEVKNEE